MTREEEYRSTILIIYESSRNFIKMSKRYGIGKQYLELISDRCTTLLDSIVTIATQDVYINRSECLDLILYVDRLAHYLRSILNESNL